MLLKEHPISSSDLVAKDMATHNYEIKSSKSGFCGATIVKIKEATTTAASVTNKTNCINKSTDTEPVQYMQVA